MKNKTDNYCRYCHKRLEDYESIFCDRLCEIDYFSELMDEETHLEVS